MATCTAARTAVAASTRRLPRFLHLHLQRHCAAMATVYDVLYKPTLSLRAFTVHSWSAGAAARRQPDLRLPDLRLPAWRASALPRAALHAGPRAVLHAAALRAPLRRQLGRMRLVPRTPQRSSTIPRLMAELDVWRPSLEEATPSAQVQ